VGKAAVPPQRQSTERAGGPAWGEGGRTANFASRRERKGRGLPSHKQSSTGRVEEQAVISTEGLALVARL
jgi:hypothetical protein